MNDTSNALYGLVWGTSFEKRRLAAIDLRNAVDDITRTVIDLLSAHSTEASDLRPDLIDRAGTSLHHLAGLSRELNSSIKTRCSAEAAKQAAQGG